MDQESLFTATKWDILKQLEQGERSPLELSKHLQSSLANISQQLRLLEMAGVVKTRRVSNREKDKPRILYGLAGNMGYVISTSDNFVDKKLLGLTDRNKVVLRIWFLDDKEVRYALEKSFWQIEPHLDGISALSYAGLRGGVPCLEYAGTANLPSTVLAGGTFATVQLHKTVAPVGHVLLSR